jgi:hypothetical protein
MYGAYSLVYFDDKEKTLNLIRNDERPMFLGLDDKAGRVYFGSEKKMLEWILNRNDCYVPDMKEVKEGMLVSFAVDDITPKLTKVERKSFFILGSGSKKEGTEQKTTLPVVVLKDSSDSSKDSIDLNAPSLPSPGADATAVSSGKVLEFKHSFYQHIKTNIKKSKKKKNKEDTNPTQIDKKQFQPTTNLHGLTQGMRIVCDVLDYHRVSSEGAMNRWLVECCLDDFANIDVFLYVSGDAGLDALLETGKFTARIVSMMYNLNAVKDVKERHKIWACDPMPSFNCYPNKKKEEDISPFSEEAGTLWNHTDQTLGD